MFYEWLKGDGALLYCGRRGLGHACDVLHTEGVRLVDRVHWIGEIACYSDLAAHPVNYVKAVEE